MNYETAEKKIREIISNEKVSDLLQYVVDFLYNNFDKYSWIGIYFVQGNDLVLDSWSGKQATEHTRIPIGRGICGSAASSGKTELVPDVNADARYLSCFVSTRSEIVVPIKKDGNVVGEIDIDSDIIDAFHEKDVLFLEKVADMLKMHI